MIRVLKWLAKVYIVVLAGGAIALATLSHEHLSTGCFASNALVWGAECGGFAGSEIVAFILNLPLNLIYAPLLGLTGLFESGFRIEALQALSLGFAMWAPLVFLLWSVLTRASRSATGDVPATRGSGHPSRSTSESSASDVAVSM